MDMYLSGLDAHASFVPETNICQPFVCRQILTDMEESQISVLPPDLAQEAQNLRREWEARNRHMMQERFLNHVSQSNTTLSSILRNSGRGKFSCVE